MTEQQNPLVDSEQFATDGLSREEDLELAELLSKWKGGKISTPVFTELARMIPLPIVEVVLFRKNGEVLETLLILRPEDDIVWPGMLHTPGAAIRASDFRREDQNPLNGVFERIQHGELNSDFIYTPVFADRLYRLGDRGPEVAEVYFTELPEESYRQHHVWYPVDKLAENPKFIQHQLGHVLIAADQYSKRDQRAWETLSLSQINIVQLSPDDWEVLRDLKLISLGHEPVAFEDQDTGMEKYLSRTEKEWRDKLDEKTSATIYFFVRDDDNFIGMVNGVIKSEEGKALVQHMYVDPKYRGRGIGRNLLDTLIQKLKEREEVRKLELLVVETQIPALKLYESLGFKLTGKAYQVKRGNQRCTEIEMELEL